MARLRLRITKGKEIAYISHLDYARTIERSIRRSCIPAAYSEGFNPHMKISFASALSVGVTSEAEYLDVELASDIDLEAAVSRLTEQMPEGIVIKQAAYVPPQSSALMATVNLASYKLVIPFLEETRFIEIEASIGDFNKDQQVFYIKETPKKGKKEIDVKQYVAYVTGKLAKSSVELVFDVKITPTGSIKPGEVLDALVTLYHLPVRMDAASIQRTGLYIVNENGRKTPLE